jgi:hypothetical protein
MNNKNLIYLSQSGLEWVGREGVLKRDHPYLFVSKKGQDPFIKIMQNLHELNDFCVALFEGVRIKIDRIKTIDEELEIVQTEEEEIDVWDKFMYGYKADQLGILYCPASSLVMLYATYIQALCTIADWFGESEFKEWKMQNLSGSHEYKRLINLLRDISNNPLEIFDDRRVNILIDDRIKKLRNAFMHGKWDVVEANLVGVNVRSCFDVVSSVIKRLEEVFDENLEPWNSKWIKTIL